MRVRHQLLCTRPTEHCPCALRRRAQLFDRDEVAVALSSIDRRVRADTGHCVSGRRAYAGRSHPDGWRVPIASSYLRDASAALHFPSNRVACPTTMPNAGGDPLHTRVVVVVSNHLTRQFYSGSRAGPDARLFILSPLL
uniref:Uncharacterized protein n=1 Tax=Plectus sambesii TaxID=2011161 RepID=A0A914W6X3_9BILA